MPESANEEYLYPAVRAWSFARGREGDSWGGGEGTGRLLLMLGEAVGAGRIGLVVVARTVVG
jgi:hypothetical protein